MSQQPPADAPAVTPQLLRDWPLPTLDDGGSKHDRGTVLVVGGADSTPGAVLLAGLAALRVGAGRLQVATVRATAVALGVALPEAMVVGLDGGVSAADADELVGRAEGAETVVLGPGLLDSDATRALLAALLPRLTCRSLVLDAVALTALAGAPELLTGLNQVVLTPNSGELAALLEGEELEGRAASARVAQRYGAVVSTQGWVVRPDGRAWRDEAGGIGLGTSGSGDVLAGAVGGLLARGAAADQAGVWGQYLHAAAGDRLASRAGRIGFLARELLDELPQVLAMLRG
ncbi:MAG: NAD(P)H-hydrate dehydratase [Frankiales bacterium]|jgi:ADP-dependent NAD(P)H-hydrate dehydratase|nr:NAD(P)H-hydrate dehydratase [Frankiales bacterium]